MHLIEMFPVALAVAAVALRLWPASSRHHRDNVAYRPEAATRSNAETKLAGSDSQLAY